MKKPLFILVFAIAIPALLQSCHLSSSGTWVDDHIDKNIKATIDSLDDKLFIALMVKDTTTVRQLMSPSLLKKIGDKLDTIVSSTSNAYNTSQYQALGNFYTKNTTTNILNTISSAKGDDNDYKFSYLALNKEMYASLFISKNLPTNFIILAIYGKYDTGWKLNILQIGNYSVLDKTAVDYYEQAQVQYNKGNIIDAADMMVMSAGIATPFGNGDLFQYKKNDEMKAFYLKVINEANAKYKFPVSVTQIKTDPQIFSISPQLLGDAQKEVYPLIKYKTQIPLTDSKALTSENNQIQMVIGKLFKGIDLNKKYIIYQAFDTIPDGKTPVKSFEFTQSLN